MSRETELKLDVPLGSLPRLTGSALLRKAAPSAPKPENLVSVYFDTDKLKLRDKGVSLRVRQIGRRFVQTVKQNNGANGASLVRGEWEQAVPARQPDLDAARDTGLAPLSKKKVRRALKPMFETRVRRKIFQLKSGDSQVELSIDQGKVEAGRKSSPICEVELELKQGQAADLFRLAKALAAEVPVQLAVRSKADRGYALLTAETPEAVRAAPIVLAHEADAQTAFQAIARACLHQVVANQPLVLAGDAEGLHQMRVGLRRLRAAMSLFSDMLRNAQTDAIKAELKWITGELGPARELDLFLKHVMKPVAARKPNGRGVAGLSKELRRSHRQAVARAHAAAESPRFRALVLDAAAWIETGDWARDGDERARLLRQRPVVTVATDELRRRRKSILKKGKKLDALDPRKRHKLRIQVKKLRYAAEFFGDAFARKRSVRRREDLVARLEKLQDALGELNDIAVHERLSERFAESAETSKRRASRTRRAFAAGRLSGREEARIAPLLAQAAKAQAGFAKAKPFWT